MTKLLVQQGPQASDKQRPRPECQGQKMYLQTEEPKGEQTTWWTVGAAHSSVAAHIYGASTWPGLDLHPPRSASWPGDDLWAGACEGQQGRGRRCGAARTQRGLPPQPRRLPDLPSGLTCQRPTRRPLSTAAFPGRAGKSCGRFLPGRIVSKKAVFLGVRNPPNPGLHRSGRSETVPPDADRGQHFLFCVTTDTALGL